MNVYFYRQGPTFYHAPTYGYFTEDTMPIITPTGPFPIPPWMLYAHPHILPTQNWQQLQHLQQYQQFLPHG
ncbi:MULTISPECIES: hypothetical protein [Bacillus cereus group]|uniref:hypothetical protein n=1 Tax=Bacillus cereus group TaxID=86661 RepID=UPI00114603FE|nr:MULTISPECIES: hypothetical protein [Bacillus cereus group]MBJ7939239.1 hypothetical protein [Bacillus cereus]